MRHLLKKKGLVVFVFVIINLVGIEYVGYEVDEADGVSSPQNPPETDILPSVVSYINLCIGNTSQVENVE